MSQEKDMQKIEEAAHAIAEEVNFRIDGRLVFQDVEKMLKDFAHAILDEVDRRSLGKEVRNDNLEEAAMICEGIASDYQKTANDNRADSRIQNFYLGKRDAATECAVKIREEKTKEPTP